MEPERSSSSLSMQAKYPRCSKRGLDLIKPPPVSKEDFLQWKALIPRIRRSRRTAVPRLLEDRKRQKNQPPILQKTASNAHPAEDTLLRDITAEHPTNQASCIEAARKLFEDVEKSPFSNESLCLEQHLGMDREIAQISISPKPVNCRGSSSDAGRYPKKLAIGFEASAQAEAHDEQLSSVDLETLAPGHDNNFSRQIQQALTSASVSTSSPKRPLESKNISSPYFDNFQVQEDDDEEDHECPAPKRQRPRNRMTYKTKARNTAIRELQERRASKQKQSNHVLGADTDESTREESCRPKAKKKKQPRRLPVDELEIVSERLDNEGSQMNEDESAELSQDPISQESIVIESQPRRSKLKVKIKVRGNGGIGTIDSEFRFPKPQNLSPRSRRRLQQAPTYSDGFEGKEADPIGRPMTVGYRRKFRERCAKIEVKIGTLTLVAERHFEGEPRHTHGLRRSHLQAKHGKRVTFTESHRDEFDRDEALTFDAQDEVDLGQVAQKSNVQPLPQRDERRNRLETTQTARSGNPVLHNSSPLSFPLERKQLHSHKARAAGHIKKDQRSSLATPQIVIRLPSRQDKCNEKLGEVVNAQVFKCRTRSDIAALQELSMVSMPKIIDSSESGSDQDSDDCSDENKDESSDGTHHEDDGWCGLGDGHEESEEEHHLESEDRSEEDFEQDEVEHKMEDEKKSDGFLEEEDAVHLVEEDKDTEEDLEEDEVHYHTENAEESVEPREEIAHHTEAEKESDERSDEEEAEHCKEELFLQMSDCGSVDENEMENVGGTKDDELGLCHEGEEEEEGKPLTPGHSQGSIGLGDTQKFVNEMSPPGTPETQFSQQSFIPSSSYFSRASQQLYETPGRDAAAFKHTVSRSPATNRLPNLMQGTACQEKSLQGLTRRASYRLGTIPSSAARYRNASLPFNPPLRRR